MLRKIGLGILAVLALLVFISFLLPKSYKVERQVAIQANDSILFHYVSHLKTWDKWTVWNTTADSTLVNTYSGEDGQTGASQSWNGEILGQGKITLSQVHPNTYVEYQLSFDNDSFTSFGEIRLEPQSDYILVSWSNEGDLGYNPIYRYMGLFLDQMMGPDFQAGLDRLKLLVEN